MKRYYNKKILPIIKKPHFKFFLFGLLVAIIGLLRNVIPPDIYSALAQTSFYSLAGLGFALLLGYGGLASLGTGAFVGIGIFGLHYFYRFLSFPLLIVIVIVVIISIIVSILFGFVSLRISGMYLAIVTMALSQIVIEIIKNIPEYASGSTGGFLTGGPRRPLQIFGIAITDSNSLIISGIFIILGLVIVYNLMHSASGRALLAIKNSETAAQTMGISLMKYRLFAFVISGIFGTFAGVLSIFFSKGGNVNDIGLAFALNILAAVIIGGMRSVWGIILGTFVIFGLQLAVYQRYDFLGNYSILINGVLIIIVVMFYPNGLIQLFSDIKQLFKRMRQKVRIKKYGTEE